MKFVQLLLLIIAFLQLSACMAEDETEDNKSNFVTLKQAQMNSDVAMNDMIETIEEESFAVTLYDTKDGYGIFHFWNSEDGWGSYARSFQEYNYNEKITKLGSFSGGNQSNTVLYGQINDGKITKVDVFTKDNKKVASKIVKGSYGTYWYYIDQGSKGLEINNFKIVAYDKEGNIVIER